jgi:hypothetical protein
LINSFVYITFLLNIIEEAERSAAQTRDYYLYLVVNAVPYVVDTLNDKSPVEFKNLIESINGIMDKRDKSYLALSKVYRNRDTVDRISALWKGVRTAVADKQRGTLHRAYADFKDELASQVKQSRKTPNITFGASKVAFYRSPPAIQFLDDGVLLKEAGTVLLRHQIREEVIELIK